jgi:hypothetical protein
MRREIYLALNRYAVGSRPADREVARPRETRLLSTAFPMSALPRIATTERTNQHVSNVPSIPEVNCLLDHLIGSREERRRHAKAKGVGGLEVDHQLELGRLFDRQL